MIISVCWYSTHIIEIKICFTWFWQQGRILFHSIIFFLAICITAGWFSCSDNKNNILCWYYAHGIWNSLIWKKIHTLVLGSLTFFTKERMNWSHLGPNFETISILILHNHNLLCSLRSDYFFFSYFFWITESKYFFSNLLQIWYSKSKVLTLLQKDQF